MLQIAVLVFFTLVRALSQYPVSLNSPVPNLPMSEAEFRFREGPDVFTPKDLVELARPSPGVANEPGDLVLVSVAKYSFEDRKNNKSVFIAPVESSVQPLEIPLANGGEAFWLDSRTIAHVVTNSDTKVQDLYAISIKFEGESAPAAPDGPKYIASFPTSTTGNYKFVPGSGHLVFSDNVYDDGDLMNVKRNDEAWDNRGTTAFVYDETYVRHWDTYRGPKHSNLFSVSLTQNNGSEWVLGNQFTNLLIGTKHKSPVEPFGGTDDFDVSKTHVIYTTKDPELPEALHTKQNVYIVSINGVGGPKELTSGKQAATHSPVLNKEGTKAAWLELDEDGYEADRAKIVIYDLNTDVRYTLTQHWDRSPDSLAFSLDSKHIYLTVGDEARGKIFVLPIPNTPSHSTTHPKFISPPRALALTHSHFSAAIQPLSGGRLLFSQNSLTKPNDVHILRGLDKLSSISSSFDTWTTDTQQIGAGTFKIDQLTSFTESALISKNLSNGEEFWFVGAKGKRIQGWILKPNGWSAHDKKKWPVLLLIHGGPQGAWEDSWSTRWNPNVFAQQGYFTVAINPTGSTTFGQELTDAIKEDWGGKPFVDLQAGWKFVLRHFPQIDTDRAVAAGASYGGYAINWIQSNPEFGFNFKALVCHDGVFDSNYNGYSTDELFFFNHEFGGQPWKERSKIITHKFSPSNFVHRWSTPELIIHSSKDYRLPETEGIAAFHALQQLHIPSRLVIFPDESHWVLNQGNSLKWHYEIFRWFDQYVGKN